MKDFGSSQRRTCLTGLLVVALLLGACSGGSIGNSTASTGSSSSGSSSGTSTNNSEGTASLSWNAPTEDANGTPITGLAGYRVYYGTDPNDLSQSVEVTGAETTTCVVQNLPAGTYYFAVSAYNSSGVESEQSNEGIITI
jgi:hypothetical protein